MVDKQDNSVWCHMQRFALLKQVCYSNTQISHVWYMVSKFLVKQLFNSACEQHNSVGHRSSQKMFMGWECSESQEMSMIVELLWVY